MWLCRPHNVDHYVATKEEKRKCLLMNSTLLMGIEFNQESHDIERQQPSKEVSLKFLARCLPSETSLKFNNFLPPLQVDLSLIFFPSLWFQKEILTIIGSLCNAYHIFYFRANTPRITFLRTNWNHTLTLTEARFQLISAQLANGLPDAMLFSTGNEKP